MVDHPQGSHQYPSKWPFFAAQSICIWLCARFGWSPLDSITQKIYIHNYNTSNIHFNFFFFFLTQLNPTNSHLVNPNPTVTWTRPDFPCPIFSVIYYQLTQTLTNSKNFTLTNTVVGVLMTPLSTLTQFSLVEWAESFSIVIPNEKGTDSLVVASS